MDTTLDFETAWGYSVTTTVTWTDTDWTRTTTNPQEWTFAIKSAIWLDDNDTWCFEVTNTVAESGRQISFYYTVSSEATIW